MNTPTCFSKSLLSLSLAAVLLSACAIAPKSPDGTANVRQQLMRLQNDGQLALLVPLAIKDAEQAVALAEQPEKNIAVSAHRLLMAERKVAMANTQAQTRLLELQRDRLNQQRDEVRIAARTREANLARADASAARDDAEQARSLASRAKADASGARSDTELAKRQALLASNREQIALSEARSARQQASEADAETNRLRDELAELNARPTERGLVITLGDVLFDSGKDSLKNGSSNHLDKLALFLQNYPERTAAIEGHTDNVGSNAANMLLSQRRADTVKAFLQEQGIAGNRLQATGKGESAPLAANISAGGRAQNRRVEVIIADVQP